MSLQWNTVPANDSVPSYKVFTKEVQKPDLDDRKYRIVELENGLRAIIIQDSAADKAAACLTVAAGSLQDPADMQGLAHFCEHMITKGSAPYPEENDFIAHVFSNGGIRNAVTGPSYQYFWCSLAPSGLYGALMRLAAFFHSPLFTHSLTAREIHAVDSESKRNAQNDSRRTLQITKALTSPSHPYWQFGTGNYESLTEKAKKLEKEGSLPDEQGTEGDGGAVGRETRRRLVEWWEQQYCAGRMTLAVLGQESLDKLTDLVASQFSQIVNRGLDPRPIIEVPLWRASETGTMVYIKTVKECYNFSLHFPLQDQRGNYKSHPAEILAHFIGHEGPGSVCAYLKKKGWLVSIRAAPSKKNHSVQTLKIDGKLTTEGYHHHEEVLLSVFDYISMLQASPLARYHFEEISTMAAIRFRFQEKTQPHLYVNAVSYELSESYPPEWILSGASLFREWDEQLVRQTLEALVPENGRVMLEAQDHDEGVVGKDIEWQTERWYGGQYYVQKMSDSFLTKAHAPNENKELRLPQQNPYIPTNFNIRKVAVPSPSRSPICIYQTPMTTLWYKKDDQFWVPKAQVKIDIRSPLAYATPRQAALTHLLVRLVDDALSEVTYDAALAGLFYSLSCHSEGIQVSVGGYNDKIFVFLQTILGILRDFSISSDRLCVVAEQIRLAYSNFYLGQPSNLSDDFAQWLIMPTIWTPNQKLDELDFIEESDIQRHRHELLSKVHLEMLINGNIEKQQAVDIAEFVQKHVCGRVLTASELPRPRSLVVPSGSNYILRKTHSNPKEVNSSLSYYCQFGNVADASLRPVLALLVHVMKEPCFTQLRTKEQLGYVVSVSLWTVTSSTGLSFKVQSVKAPWFVEDRVDSFLVKFREALVETSTKEFEAKKEGLASRKLEKPKNLYDEGARFWADIASGYFDFLQDEIDAAAIRALTHGQTLAAFDRFLSPFSKTRKKFSVQLVSQKMQEQPDPAEGAVIIGEESESLSIFKASLGCYPAPFPLPVINRDSPA